MRHRYYRRFRPHRNHYRYHKRGGGYKAIAETALHVAAVLGTAVVALLFKRKP